MNAADTRSVRNAAKKERLAIRQANDDTRAVLSTPAGRRYVWRLLGKCGVFRQDSPHGSTGEVLFQSGQEAGRRKIGLELMAEIQQVDPSLYATMAKEAVEEERTAQPDEQPQHEDTHGTNDTDDTN